MQPQSFVHNRMLTTFRYSVDQVGRQGGKDGCGSLPSFLIIHLLAIVQPYPSWNTPNVINSLALFDSPYGDGQPASLCGIGKSAQPQSRMYVTESCCVWQYALCDTLCAERIRLMVCSYIGVSPFATFTVSVDPATMLGREGFWVADEVRLVCLSLSASCAGQPPHLQISTSAG
jgi:hypothetical protein